jgi:hypothetical protein
MKIKRCEGYRKYGGAFSFGPPVWEQCKENAIVELTIKQEKTETFPACKTCWNEVLENKIKVVNVIPLKNS